MHGIVHGRDADASRGGKPLDPKAEVHVAYALPLPADAPATGRTPPVKPSSMALAEPGTVTYKHMATFVIKRAARATQRAVERRPAVFEVFVTTKGFLGFGGGTACVARGVLPLDSLLSDSTLELLLPLHAPEGIPDAVAAASGTAAVPAAYMGGSSAAAKRNSGAGGVSPAAAGGAAGGKGGAAGGAGAAAAGGAAGAADSIDALTGSGSAHSAATAAASALSGEGERGALHVCLRLNAPLRDQALQFVERKVLVMQDMPVLAAPALPAMAPLALGGAGAVHAAPAASPARAPAASGGGAVSVSGAGSAAAVPAAGGAAAARAGAGAGAGPATAAAAAAGAATSGASAAASAKVAASREASAKAAAVAATLGHGGAGGPGGGDDDDDDAYMSTDFYVSSAAIDDEVERCKEAAAAATAAGKGDDAELLADRVTALDIAKTLLGASIAGGTLSLPDYMGRVEARLKTDFAMAKALLAAVPNNPKAAIVMRRIKAMKGELADLKKMMEEG